MEKLQSDGMSTKENNCFTPIAKVAYIDRLVGRSTNMDRVLGKEVKINADSRHDFKSENQQQTSYLVTPLGSNINSRIATKFMSTTCRKTSELLGIKLIKLADSD